MRKLLATNIGMDKRALLSDWPLTISCEILLSSEKTSCIFSSPEQIRYDNSIFVMLYDRISQRMLGAFSFATRLPYSKVETDCDIIQFNISHFINPR